MSIYDKARELGKEMLECEEAQKLYAARETFENSEAAKTLVDEYTDLKNKWQEIMGDENADKAILTDLGEQIVAKEKEIKENEITMGLMKAESEYGAFVNSIFNLISATIQGQDSAQGGCDPSCCAGCSGCH